VTAGSAADDVQGSTLTLARALVACPSITPADAGALTLIERRMSFVGCRCERMDRNGVGNLWVTHGAGAPLIVLAGHVDVVPPGPLDQWTVDPFEGAVRDGWLIGRGSADMKGSVAAMVTAFERLVAREPDHRGSLALLLTGDEEGDALDGTRAVVDGLVQRGITIDCAVLGEPTSAERFGDTIKNGRRGSLTGVLRVRGVQCHVAYPERGKNPIHAALPALAELAGTVWDRGNPYFGPTTLQIANVHAGTGTANVVPGSLEVQFNLRFSPDSPAASLRERIEAILTRSGVDYQLQWTLSAEPFMTPAGNLVAVVADTIQSVTGVRPELSTSGGTSDGRFLAGISREVIEFGPLNDTIHKVDERISVSDLGRLSTIYEGIARKLIASN
jgi:succinyl-diaminopimelate desuccinylase